MADSPSSINISLGGRTFSIAPLTIRQLRDIQIGVALPPSGDPQQIAKRNVDRSVAIIVAALSRNYSEMTEDAVLNLEATKPQLDEVTDEILVFSGLVSRKDLDAAQAARKNAAGEQAAAASTGTP